MIDVEFIEPGQYRVTVQKDGTTQHQVSLADTYYRKLTGGTVSEEQLVKELFEFLLERESNGSILRSFELSVINRYFPEYEEEIRNRLRSSEV